MQHDWRKYWFCMEELKKRFAILDDALSTFRKDSIASVPNVELASLQLRKIYELIGFAALATNRERYGAVRARYEKDWNLAEVLKLVEQINPHSFPAAYRDVGGDIVDLPKLQFTRKSLTRLHGELGTILHARNPYRGELDYNFWARKCCSHRDNALEILNFHRVWPDPAKDQTFYLVQMHTLPKGDIQVAVFDKIDEQ